MRHKNKSTISSTALSQENPKQQQIKEMRGEKKKQNQFFKKRRLNPNIMHNTLVLPPQFRSAILRPVGSITMMIRELQNIKILLVISSFTVLHEVMSNKTDDTTLHLCSSTHLVHGIQISLVFIYIGMGCQFSFPIFPPLVLQEE